MTSHPNSHNIQVRFNLTFMNRIRLLRTLFGALIFVGLLLVSYHVVNAQADQAITIIPPKFELFANPGDTLSEKMRVRNETDVPVTYTIVVEDFSTSGEEGHVVLEEGESNTSFSLAKWIEPETRDLILQPNEEVSLTFRINVPRDAEPGGHYASIIMQTGSDQMIPGSAVVSQRVGTLILLRVSGNVSENAILENFTVPSYLEKGPVVFSARIKNEGNVHVMPQGTIVIKNMFGKKVDEIPFDGRNVLPGAIRKMDTTWDAERLLGRYTATLVSTYGQQKKPITAAVTFTVASKTALAIIGISVIAGVILIVSLIAGRKRFGKAMKVIATGR